MEELGFFASAWAFSVVAFTSIWFLGILTLFILWLVHEDCTGWSLFWIAILGFLAFQTYSADWMTILYCTAAYIPLGVGWSMYRWKRFCSDKVDDHNAEMARKYPDDLDENTDQRKAMARDELAGWLNPSSNISRFAHWIIAWPFSVLENVLGDLYDMIVRMIKTYLVNVYQRISNNAMKGVK